VDPPLDGSRFAESVVSGSDAVPPVRLDAPVSDVSRVGSAASSSGSPGSSVGGADAVSADCVPMPPSSKMSSSPDTLPTASAVSNTTSDPPRPTTTEPETVSASYILLPFGPSATLTCSSMSSCGRLSYVAVSPEPSSTISEKIVDVLV
jgi:hypothetical protein